MKTYTISEDELLTLIEKSLKYDALECGGVDNWTWYCESLHDFSQMYGHDTYEEDDAFGEMAEEELKRYCS